jgi:NADH-quinone oxidoreductase subunit M
MLVPLAVMTLWLGIYPVSFTHIFDGPVTALVQAHVAAVQPAAVLPAAVQPGVAVAMETK